MNWQNIISFWFEELTPKQHFVKDLQLDSLIKERFGQGYTKLKLVNFIIGERKPKVAWPKLSS